MPLDLSREIVARWNDPDPKHVPLLKEAGVTAVLPATPNEAFAKACAAAGLRVAAADEIAFVTLGELARAAPDAPVALKNGLWPGISREPAVRNRGDETASASREPWVDSNGYWIGCLRALYPRRAAVLAYTAPEQSDRLLPFDSLELALIEAWVAGGNYVLAVEPRYRAALLAGDAKALAAWKQLGRTTRWLREHRDLFLQPAFPTITALVDPGPATAEIANLLYRRNASPALARVDDPPAPDPGRRRALVAANIRPPGDAVLKRMLAHAEAGTAVVTTAFSDPARKPVRSDPDRDIYTIGRGQVFAYRKPIADPSEFALDVIDVVTHKARAVRLWNAPSVIALATAAPKGGALLHAINYGSPSDAGVQARIQGHFASATLLRPDAAPLALEPARRGTMTEVQIPGLRRLGVVELK